MLAPMVVVAAGSELAHNPVRLNLSKPRQSLLTHDEARRIAVVIAKVPERDRARTLGAASFGPTVRHRPRLASRSPALWDRLSLRPFVYHGARFKFCIFARSVN